MKKIHNFRAKGYVNFNHWFILPAIILDPYYYNYMLTFGFLVIALYISWEYYDENDPAVSEEIPF